MKISNFFAVALIAGLTAFAPFANAANLVVDGDFTDPAISESYHTYYAVSDMGAWHVTSSSPTHLAGSVDHIGTLWDAPSLGTHSVDMDGYFSRGMINQSISMGPGAYRLTFSLSGNPDGGDPLKSVRASIEGIATQDFTYITGSNSHNDMQYVQKSLLFNISNLGSYVLSFLSLNAEDSAYGAVIGNVAINAVPLPGAFLLFGTGLAALAGMRARKGNRRS